MRVFVAQQHPFPGDHDLAREFVAQLLATVAALRAERTAFRSALCLMVRDVDGVLCFATAANSAPVPIPRELRAEVRGMLIPSRRPIPARAAVSHRPRYNR